MDDRELELKIGIKIVDDAKEFEKNGKYDKAATEYREAKDFFKKIGQNKLYAKCMVAHAVNVIKHCLAGRDIEDLSENNLEFYIKKINGIDNIELTEVEKYEIYIKTYRELEKVFRDINIIDKENDLYFMRMSLYHKLHREQYKKKNITRKERLRYFSQFIFRGFLHHFYRHGERPGRALLWIIATILTFATAYKVFEIIEFTDPQKTVCFWQSLYFSVVTFTTLGYGDIVPTCLFGQLLAILEVLLGILTISLFIPLIIKKLE